MCRRLVERVVSDVSKDAEAFIFRVKNSASDPSFGVLGPEYEGKTVSRNVGK
jgi:hypothetical protein